MALNCKPIWVCSSQPCYDPWTADLRSNRCRALLELRPLKREHCRLRASVQIRANAFTEYEKPTTDEVEMTQLSDSEEADQALDIVSFKFPNVSSPLRKPLSITKSPSDSDGSNMRVAYLGIPGAYSEEAVLKVFPNCEPVPFDQLENAFQAVENSLVDKVVLPIENSLSGSVHCNYDLILRHRLYIVREIELVVNNCLLALPGVQTHEVKRVISEPQELDQCEKALTEMGVVRLCAYDAAVAAQIVASSAERDIAAIASPRAAELYGLDILVENVQDKVINITRFLVLERERIIPKPNTPCKTSIVFSIDGGPEELLHALAVFFFRDIFLSKTEIRPQTMNPLRIVQDFGLGTVTYFDYIYYIDFEESIAEVRAQNALTHLEKFVQFLRVLGSYPVEPAS